MENKKKWSETTPPKVARVLRLIDELEEHKTPLPKRMRLSKAVEVQVPTVKGQFAGFMVVQRRTGLSPPVQPMAQIDAFIANKLVAATPINTTSLVSGVTPMTALSIPSLSFQPLGSNIQDILDNIEVEEDYLSSIGMECEKPVGEKATSQASTPAQVPTPALALTPTLVSTPIDPWIPTPQRFQISIPLSSGKAAATEDSCSNTTLV